MYIFPQLPHRLMLADYLKGRRSQIYLDSDNVHQYEKYLNRIRQAQQSIERFKSVYKHKTKGNYCPLRLGRAVHNHTMREFGFSLEWSDYYFES